MRIEIEAEAGELVEVLEWLLKADGTLEEFQTLINKMSERLDQGERVGEGSGTT